MCKNATQGISYERYVDNPNDSSIIQGSFGRLTGHDDNGVSICYTNIPSLENYIKLWDNNMEFKEGIPWNTKTTTYDKDADITYSTGTFNSVNHIEQLQDNCSEKVKEDRGDPIIKKFYGESGETEGIDWFKSNLSSKFSLASGRKYRGPNKTKKTQEYYIRPIGKGKDRNNILSTDKLEKHKRWNLDGNSGKKRTLHTWFPCYSDVNDATTLEWWLIYYEISPSET